MSEIKNPFKPGAGHQPPYLAGRDAEKNEFSRLISQTTILENLVLTGLRGVGKTVLLEQLKPIAQQAGWLWIGTDLSESASLNEENIATRLLTDLSVITSSVVISQYVKQGVGFTSESQHINQTLNFSALSQLYVQTP